MRRGGAEGFNRVEHELSDAAQHKKRHKQNVKGYEKDVTQTVGNGFSQAAAKLRITLKEGGFPGALLAFHLPADRKKPL
jgi:hypothetical protein